jgi:hypothetical protein
VIRVNVTGGTWARTLIVNPIKASPQTPQTADDLNMPRECAERRAIEDSYVMTRHLNVMNGT